MKSSRLHFLNALLSLCVLGADAGAQAAIQTHTRLVTGITAAGGGVTTLPAFDPNLGVLRWLDIKLAGSVSGVLALENTTAAPAPNGAYYVGHVVTATIGATTLSNGINPAFESDNYAPTPPNMAPFDGVLDFQGPSSTTYNFSLVLGSGSPTKTWLINDPAAYPAWIGQPGGATNLVFQLNAVDFASGFLSPGVMESHSITSTVAITLRYGYEPLPAPICQPMFYWHCPCGTWQQAPDIGCANSASGGAQLSITGNASYLSDSLLLLGAGMPDGPALYYQGAAFNYGTTLFGDGLLCVSGSIVRLGIKFNVGGASSYPQAGDPSISLQGGIVGPALGCYQIYYRDAAAFCTSATFNVSNGYALNWVP